LFRAGLPHVGTGVSRNNIVGVPFNP